MEIKVQITDYLVVGSGIAGLSLAFKLSMLGEVMLLTKKEHSDCNTNYAQGGIASVFSNTDSFDSHYADTLKAGGGINRPEVVDLAVKLGPKLILELTNSGIQFSKKTDGQFDLGKEGGHSFNRIVHARDLTGQEIESGLINVILNKDRLKTQEGCCVIDLLIRDRRCVGVVYYNEMNCNLFACFAKAVILATGGIGQVYKYTTNPEIATGDGIAIASRAGASIASMEFVQFHPTALYPSIIEGKRAFLVSEAVRGEGGILKTADGEILKINHPLGSLAPRDIVARSIYFYLKENQKKYVLLDATSIDGEYLEKRFPQIYNKCLSYEIDIRKDPIPVVPAAHYICGGIDIDMNGRSSIPSLYAIGEVAHSGLHGANRLASNSLLEALVFAEQAYRHIESSRLKTPEVTGLKALFVNEDKNQLFDIQELKEELRETMWKKVGIVRNNKGLDEAETFIRKWTPVVGEAYDKTRFDLGLVELRNLFEVAKFIVMCSRMRQESRGLHFLEDHPERDDNYHGYMIIEDTTI
ncbi:MAG: L-aspartate oxidase [Candidatus Coatesbacteria bacterium]|nr:L-aspartate oxidase [Candidatus Coatesbacteria bacterium]